MATKVVVCPECESALEPGRFSCPTCGAVVAAVASMPRSFTPALEAAPPVVEPAPDATVAASMAAPSLTATPTAAASYTPAPPVPPSVEPAAPTTYEAAQLPATHVPAASVATYTPAPPATSWPEPPSASTAPAWPSQVLAVEPAPASPEPVTAPFAPPPVEASGWPVQPAAPAAPPPVEATKWPDQPAWPPIQAAVVAAEPPIRSPAGAYLPPSAVLPPAEALPIPGRNGTGGEHAEPAPVAKPTTLAGRFALGDADGPLGLPVNAPGRTIALGAAIAGLGFLLPWAEIVIGSSSMGSFLDMWGLAGPGHPIVLLLLIAVGFLAVAHEKWPVRVGAGTASIVLGSVLLGLAFPYVMGPFREAVGVYVTAAGAIVMIAGGLLARVPPRHADVEASV
jgi:hypothetical protein